jgi:hypothetical protein
MGKKKEKAPFSPQSLPIGTGPQVVISPKPEQHHLTIIREEFYQES